MYLTRILAASYRGILVPVSHTYDVLRMTKKGPEWIDTAPDLEAVKLTVQQRLKHNPGCYLIFNQMTQEKVLIERLENYR